VNSEVAAPEKTAPEAEAPIRTKPRNKIVSRLTTPAAVIALVDLAVVIFFGIVTPDHAFFTAGNFTNVALSGAEGLILGVAAAFLLGAGEFDLSLGANVILSSILGALVMRQLDGGGTNLTNASGAVLGLGVLCCIVSGTVLGLVNAFVVTRLNVNALIGTLGTMGIFTGAAFVLVDGTDIIVPSNLQSGFGIKTVLSIVPVAAIVAAAIVVIGYIMLTQTRFGLFTLAAGSARDAAVRSGIPVKFHILRLFVMAGFLCGIVAVLDISRYATTDISGHTLDSLSAIAGSVIGGTSLFGGRVSIVGMVFGCLLPILLGIGLVQMNLPAFYQEIAVGVVLIIAVAVRSRQPSGASGRSRLRQLGTRILGTGRS
jgi:ribose transport system permease protein